MFIYMQLEMKPSTSKLGKRRRNSGRLIGGKCQILISPHPWPIEDIINCEYTGHLTDKTFVSMQVNLLACQAHCKLAPTESTRPIIRNFEQRSLVLQNQLIARPETCEIPCFMDWAERKNADPPAALSIRTLRL